MLCEVCQMDAIGEQSFAFEWDDIGENFDERRFSCAVWGTEGDFIAAIDSEIDVFIDDVIVV